MVAARFLFSHQPILLYLSLFIDSERATVSRFYYVIYHFLLFQCKAVSTKFIMNRYIWITRGVCSSNILFVLKNAVHASNEHFVQF